MSQTRPTLWRALVAALALYALLLQPFVAAATPLVAGSGAICHPVSGDPAPAGPAERPGCCLAVCQFAAPVPPLPSVAEDVAWPPRATIELAWRPAEIRLATSPPHRAARARGPPLV